MAHLNQRHPQNVAGDFYVNSTCIDCDTCRWMAPEVFYRTGEQSAVHHQPSNNVERLRALRALIACPTGSIGTIKKPPRDIKAAQYSFPLQVAENVYDCGYHSEKSYGAASYFVQRQDGNILIDSPRFAPPLVKRLETMGGIRYLYLTHKDDVAEHRKFQAHFDCQRILHEDDVCRDTQNVKIRLCGAEPFQLVPGLLIIPVPGHTKGHSVLLYKDRFLFTGDHLAWSDELQHLLAFHDACWYSWSALTRSMRRLLDYSFEWVLPGHGRRYHADPEMMRRQLEQCIAWMEAKGNHLQL